MLSFREANEYIYKTSANDIFKRVAIYSAWNELKGNRQFGHDIIMTLIAAFSGPFDGIKNNSFQDKAIKDLLDLTDWGWNDWSKSLYTWGEKYYRTKDDNGYFNNILSILVNEGKSDQIYEYLTINAQNPPTTGNYFPEYAPGGFLNGNQWSRI